MVKNMTKTAVSGSNVAPTVPTAQPTVPDKPEGTKDVRLRYTVSHWKKLDQEAARQGMTLPELIRVLARNGRRCEAMKSELAAKSEELVSVRALLDPVRKENADMRALIATKNDLLKAREESLAAAIRACDELKKSLSAERAKSSGADRDAAYLARLCCVLAEAHVPADPALLRQYGVDLQTAQSLMARYGERKS